MIVSQGTAKHVENDPNSMTGQYLSGKRSIELFDRPHGAGRTAAADHRGLRQQPEARVARSAGRIADLRDGRIRLGQVHAHQRHAVSRGLAASVRFVRRARTVRIDRRARTLRQGDQRRPVADRPYAALESRPPTRAFSRRSANCSRACRHRRNAATIRAVSRST